ncbi:hypothetical protein DFQ28_009489 [Apophysomyces sp. BC1034]|nr:hypothetical protein DFQ28_009489 [Apophysomyces sp. BC1034]
MGNCFSVKDRGVNPPIESDSARARPSTGPRNAVVTAKTRSNSSQLSGLSSKATSPQLRDAGADSSRSAAEPTQSTRTTDRLTSLPGEILDNIFWRASVKDLQQLNAVHARVRPTADRVLKDKLFEEMKAKIGASFSDIDNLKNTLSKVESSPFTVKQQAELLTKVVTSWQARRGRIGAPRPELVFEKLLDSISKLSKHRDGPLEELVTHLRDKPRPANTSNHDFVLRQITSPNLSPGSKLKFAKKIREEATRSAPPEQANTNWQEMEPTELASVLTTLRAEVNSIRSGGSNQVRNDRSELRRELKEEIAALDSQTGQANPATLTN